jgi:hypothetical protein
VIKAAVGMFIACGAIDVHRNLADDKCLEVLLHDAPAEDNAVYLNDIEKCVGWTWWESRWTFVP